MSHSIKKHLKITYFWFILIPNIILGIVFFCLDGFTSDLEEMIAFLYFFLYVSLQLLGGLGMMLSRFRMIRKRPILEFFCWMISPLTLFLILAFNRYDIEDFGQYNYLNLIVFASSIYFLSATLVGYVRFKRLGITSIN